MDLALVLVAFLAGFAATLVRLPPLVGYLVAGFVLHAFGYETTPAIETIGDLGVVLLLFGIGLKLRFQTLARPAIWAGASVHLAITTALFGTLLLGLGSFGLPLVTGLSPGQAALIAFALSFSSSVFAVKALEERDEATSLHGRMAIGILVIQDIFAVIFLTVAVETPPMIWALPLVVVVIAARPLYGWLLNRIGHGEMLVLFGLALAIGVGAEAFSQVGINPDFGALLVGLTLASHPRAAELSEKLLSLKDVLLIGFFLSIGLGGMPGLSALVVVAVIICLLPLKGTGFFWLLSRFRYRTSTAWHSAVTLSTYSEFGLIVAVIGVERGLMADEWTSAIAVAVAASLAIAAPLNSRRYLLFDRLSDRLRRVQRHPVQSDDAAIETGGARIIVFGMGRVGTGAYDELVRRRGDVVVGIERLSAVVRKNVKEGRATIKGDALDSEFWSRLRLHSEVELVVLAMGDQQANLEVVREVKKFVPEVPIAAAASYTDHVIELERAGVTVARNLFHEAGLGLADDACDLLPEKPAGS
jgi:predicted Kef-type K+ transport protein